MPLDARLSGFISRLGQEVRALRQAAVLGGTVAGQVPVWNGSAWMPQTPQPVENVDGGTLPLSIMSSTGPVQGNAFSSVTAVNRGIYHRVIVPRSGKITGMAVYLSASGGNIDLGLYSNGSTLSRLWSTGSIPCPTTLQQWLDLGNPNLDVVAGQELWMAVASSATTAQFHRPGALSSTLARMPVGWWDVSGAQGTFLGVFTGFPLPASVPYSSLVTSGQPLTILAKIT